MVRHTTRQMSTQPSMKLHQTCIRFRMILHTIRSNPFFHHGTGLHPQMIFTQVDRLLMCRPHTILHRSRHLLRFSKIISNQSTTLLSSINSPPHNPRTIAIHINLEWKISKPIKFRHILNPRLLVLKTPIFTMIFHSPIHCPVKNKLP